MVTSIVGPRLCLPLKIFKIKLNVLAIQAEAESETSKHF